MIKNVMLCKIAIVVFVLFCVFCIKVAAQNTPNMTEDTENIATAQTAKLEDVVPLMFLDMLKETGKIEMIHEVYDTSLVLLPVSEFSQIVRDGRVPKPQKKCVPFNAEYLYIVPKCEGDEGVLGDINDISRIFRSMSKMSGMRYHYEKKKTELLYKSAYMIQEPNLKKLVKVPDPIDDEPDGLTAFCMQDDHTYGKLCYKLSYRQNATTVYVEFLLVTPMAMLGIKGVKENNLKVNVMAVDCGDCILLYLGTDAAAEKLGIINMRNQMADSMAVRIEAIYKWFLKEL